MIKVLVVEDEAPIRQWFQFCISKLPGYSCILAADAEAGIRLYKAERPEIILTDIEMPGMDGLKMLESVRQIDPTVYMVVITSHEDFNYARTALKLGIAEYMLKIEMTEEGLQQLLERAQRVIVRQDGQSPMLKSPGNQTGVTLQIQRAIDYLEEHYSEKITLRQAAEIASFSPEHFSRVFSRETGISFVAFLNNIRMRNAVKLLETTDLKVYEIAEKVGFFSLNYFSTSFKKKFGMNPYEYQVSYQRGQKEI